MDVPFNDKRMTRFSQDNLLIELKASHVTGLTLTHIYSSFNLQKALGMDGYILISILQMRKLHLKELIQPVFRHKSVLHLSLCFVAVLG